MTDDELNKLKDLPVPPPRAGAKADALAAALAAFDGAPDEKGEAEPKGKDATGSHTHADNARRRQRMRASVFYAMAAGIALAVVVTPAALYFLDSGHLPPIAASPPTETPVQESIGAGDAENAPLGPLRADFDWAESGEEFNETEAHEFGRTDRLASEDDARDGVIAIGPLRQPRSQAGGSASKAKPAAAQPPAPNDEMAIDDSQEHRDKFEASTPNPVKQVKTEPVSTFSIDVDTASYAFVHRALNAGRLPPKQAVRVEEMINYFPYDYPHPETAETPFKPTVTVVPSPWKPGNKLIHIGIKGYDIAAAERPRANLVFLIDVSGSMDSADKLPLVKNAFRMLVGELQPEDTVGIVTYASGAGVLLEPTRIAEKPKILAAIERLGAGGSTAGAAGIADAYRLAEAHYDKEGVNRIVLATDGDFNVGISDMDELKGFIERKRKSGIFLSILGVGQGNYNDALMQALAQNGNGVAAYVDTLNEARKVLVDEASSTLFPIAKDVKIQVEFNPSQIAEYRLIGYETRALRREDFNNDKVDAGDIGSGHTVTAIYEVTPVGAATLADDLRYQQAEPVSDDAGKAGEYAFLKLRYKLPEEDSSKLITLPIGPEAEKAELAQALEEVRFSVAVAAFGQLLTGAPYLQDFSYDDVRELAQNARGTDKFGYRAEFLNLVRLAESAQP